MELKSGSSVAGTIQIDQEIGFDEGSIFDVVCELDTGCVESGGG